MHQPTPIFPHVPAQLTNQALVSQAGLGVLTSFLNALSFRRLCENRFSQFVPATAVHRPGKMMADLAIMLSAGGEQVTDIDQLSSSQGLFGTVASEATISRFMKRIKDQPAAFDYAFATMHRTLRSRVWAAAGPRNPPLRATRLDPLIIDIDASLVHVHSDKEHAAGTYKRGYGFSPITASVDYGKGNGTAEILAVMLRPGNKGANSAADHITILDQALAQLPDEFYGQDGILIGEKILVRTDSGGASREFLYHLDSLGLQFSTSYALPVVNERFIGWISEKKYWEPATDQHGQPRRDAWVIDATKVLNLNNYPPGTRIYLRAEPLHPGAKASLFDTDGNRITAFLTNAPRYNVAFLDARHPARGRCENRVKTLKSTGLSKLPYWSFAANQAWINVAVLAMNLTSWIQLTLLPVNHPAGCWDVKRWRYRLYCIAGKLITSSRKTRLLIPGTASEATLLTVLLERAQAGYQQWRNGHLTA